MKVRISSVVKGVAVLLAALVVTVFAVLYSADWSAYKGEFASLVRDATGRDLVIDGAFAPKIGLTPAISVDGVRFANAAWGTRKDMARIDRFRAEIELLPILFGDIRIRRIVLSGADILLETRADGTGNWAMAAAGSKAAAPSESRSGALPSVDRVLIENSVVAWRDGRTGTHTTARIDRLQAATEAPGGPLRVAFRGRYNDEEIALDGQLGSPRAAAGGAPLTVDLRLEAGGAAITVKGAIAHPAAAKGVELAVSATGDDLAALRGMAGHRLPSLGPYRLSATLRDRDRAWEIKDLSLSVGKSDLKGTLSIEPAARPVAIAASLTSTLLRVQDFRDRSVPRTAAPAMEPKTGADAAAGDGRIFPADALPLDGLKAVDASLSLRAGRVEADKVALRTLTLEMTVRNGRLALRPLEGEVAGGRFSADVDIDASAAVPTVALRSRIARLDMAALLRAMGRDRLVEGRIDAAASLTGSGTSVRAIMAGLNGSIETTMQDGRLDDDLIELLSADVVKAIAPLSSGDKGMRIACLVGRYDVRGGKLVSRATVFDTDRLLVTGTGGVDLATEKIDFLIDPKAKEASLMKLVVPLRVGGTLASPSVYPDPGGVVKGALGIAAGIATGGVLPLVGTLLSGVAGSDDNPCLAALSGRKPDGAGTPSQAPANGKPSSPAREIGKAIEGVGKGIGEGLKGLFGR